MKVWLPVIEGGSGADVFTRRLAGGLRRLGIIAEMTWFRRGFQFAPFLLKGVSPPPGTQVVHANSWNGFAFQRGRIPLMATSHLDVLDPLYRPYKSTAQRLFHETAVRWFETASFRAANAITVVSEATRRSLQRVLEGFDAQVVYNWVDTATFTPGVGRPGGSGPFRLLFVGNLSRRKGADLLAPIMKKLGSGFELRFTSGLGRHETAIQAENMSSLGRITDERRLVEVYRECDALLFPSRLEGFSLVPLEAMSCGKPVIAAGTSSLPEVVDDGVTGILCPRDDIEAFVSACKRLAGDPQLLVSLGQAARARVEDLFSEEIILPQYASLYERLADRAER